MDLQKQRGRRRRRHLPWEERPFCLGLGRTLPPQVRGGLTRALCHSVSSTGDNFHHRRAFYLPH